MDEPIQELERFTDTDKQAAAHTISVIDGLVVEIDSTEQRLSASWIKLGRELVTVRQKLYWLLWGYSSFSAYLRELSERFQTSQTRLFEAYSVTEKLLPAVGEETLEKIGLTKATELKRELRRSGVELSDELIAHAADPKVGKQQLRAELFQAHNLVPEYAGRYRDLGGYPATDEEWAEIQRAFNIAERTDPVIAKDIPAWARLKEVMRRLAVNYLVTFEREVEGFE